MYSLYNYSKMIADEVRMSAYQKALEACIKPGDSVIDLGAGSGIFSLMACRLGAKKVYAVDLANAIHIGREISQANGFADKIEWIHGDATKVKFPERVDLIITDIRGQLPLLKKNISLLADVRDRCLKPGGLVLPFKDTLRMAVACSPTSFQNTTEPWAPQDYGFDLSVFAQRHCHQWKSQEPKEDEIISDVQDWAVLHYQTICNPNISNTIKLKINRNTSAHGFYLWFDAQIAPGIGFSGAPGPNRPIVYGCGFFSWPNPVEVKKHDCVEISLNAHLVGEEYVWTWHTKILSINKSEPYFESKQSTFLAEPQPQLKKRAHSHIPRLDEDGKITSAALLLMDGGHDLESIARELMGRFPGRFTKYNDSLAFAGNISEKFSQ